MLAILTSLYKRSPGCRKTIWRLRTLYRVFLFHISPVLLLRLRYRSSRGKWPNLLTPSSYDEKLIWLNLYWQHPLKAQCGDKYSVREYVIQAGLGHLLPDLLGVFQSASEIDFDALPSQFVLKCTHGCKMNIICPNKSQLNIKNTKRVLNRWLRTNYSTIYGELHYSGMTPRIICEPFLGSSEGDLPWDYKVHCFGGKARYIEVCSNRNKDGHEASYNIYSPEGTPLPHMNHGHSHSFFPLPESHKEMISAAERLANNIPYVRVDFFSINCHALLGEMTFTPAGCIDVDLTDYAQEVYGKLIVLPDKLLS